MTECKKIAILGAGISGLALAWYLEKKHQDAIAITIFDKNQEVGGWMQTKKAHGAYFECGPRSIRTRGTGIKVLELIEELGIQEKVLESSKEAHVRYLAIDGTLKILPHNIKSFVTSPFLFTILGALFRDLIAKKKRVNEETVADFFVRRCGKKFHDTFIDPLMRGIYATSSGMLSMQSINRSLVEKDSLLALFSSQKPFIQSPWIESMQGKIISFHEGMQFLPKALQKQLQATFLLNCPVQNIEEHADKVIVNGSFEFDEVISTLTASTLSSLLPQDDPLKAPLAEFSSTSVVTVCFGWVEKVVLPPGFGFLCASSEEKELLGILFDSNVFPEHNGELSCRISVMMEGKGESESIEMAAQFVRKYLKILFPASVCFVQKSQDAIGKYTIGHNARCNALEKNRRLQPLGTSFYGVSIGDSIHQAHLQALKD